jgi:transcriptional regulator with XRE-family HTH domain
VEVGTKIGDKIREMRLARVLTQEELARKAGVGSVTIVRVEKGQVAPHQQTIRKIARGLGVNPEKLVR